jgi:hypothetical protein
MMLGALKKLVGIVIVVRVGAVARPNVLFMMADQLRFDALGAAGNTAAITPALDRLAAEGLRMEWSWSSTPTCTPARAGILVRPFVFLALLLPSLLSWSWSNGVVTRVVSRRCSLPTVSPDP